MSGEHAFFAVDQHPACRTVDRKPAEAQHLAGCWPVPAGPAPQDGPQPGQQFARIERFGQVIVGADFQADDAVRVLAACGQHQDRHVGAGTDRSAEFESVAVRQHQVE